MPSQKTVLVVDDEPHIVELVRLYLSDNDFHVETATTGPEALEQFNAVCPSLVVLDLMLPELDGYEVCRHIRRASDVPIIMLTARTDDIDKIVGLELGADDYLGKPFNPRELVARIKAVLRRAAPAVPQAGEVPQVINIGNTTIDPARREVTVGERIVKLRAKEFDLLRAFIEHIGIVLERDKLLNIVWGYDYFGDTRTVDVHVAHLRERIAGSDLTIQTVRSVGYKMVLDKQA